MRSLAHKSLETGSSVRSLQPCHHQLKSTRRVAAGSKFGDEFHLKLLMFTIFIPEGLSFFVGDFRLSFDRVLLIILLVVAISRLFKPMSGVGSVRVPSDILAPIAGCWMMLAATVTDGFAGLKGSGIAAVEFTGAYFAFRYLLSSVGSTVRLTRFSCKLTILVVAVALLDPLTDKLFTYEFVKSFTGYVKPSYESALAARAEALFRDGSIRAMGTLEHSILFGSVCVWFGTLAFITFPYRLLGWGVAAIAFLGVWFSQARSPLLGYLIAFGLAIFYVATPHFAARWKLIGLAVGTVVGVIFTFSGSPIATLMRLTGISAETGWYRQAIWDTAVPVVLNSPVFGIGLGNDWDWQVHGGLVSASVDAFWLKAAMMYGIPGSLLIFLTLVSAVWMGPVDRCPQLTGEEKRLSVALGIVISVVVFLGFIVHYWGACWTLIAVFAGMRANLAEAAIQRSRSARISNSEVVWRTGSLKQA